LLTGGHSKRQKYLGHTSEDHIEYWTKETTWPAEFFCQDNMNHLLARRKSTASLRRKRSGTTITASATSSDQRPTDETAYKNPSYDTVLETEAGSYMGEYRTGVTETSEKLCQNLLQNDQKVPSNTIFDLDHFRKTCDRLRGKRTQAVGVIVALDFINVWDRMNNYDIDATSTDELYATRTSDLYLNTIYGTPGRLLPKSTAANFRSQESCLEVSRKVGKLKEGLDQGRSIFRDS
jgi:hypothetical protein